MTREIANLTGRTDSENENAEITPDTDTDSQEHLQKTPHVSSFKRPAPVMGNRGLETRNSKRSQYHPQLQSHKKESPPPITVAALEVQNVKRAINRYGTLPKGARIGAYLDSLQTDGAAAPAVPGQKNGTLVELPPPPPQQSQTLNNHSAGVSPHSNSMSPRAVAKAQPQMIRSNSSGGVTMANSATSSLNKLQRHRTTTDGTMIFSSFRGTSGSPKRSFNPALADLEFPPPPLDLPPPPEEFETPHDIELPRGNVDPMQMSVSLTPSNDVSNTEPSVEEASSRFGVSLRKREPSTDSCSSLGSPAGATSAAETAIEPPMAATNSTPKDKLDMKIVAEIKERAEQQQKKLASDVPNNNVPNKPVDHVSQLVNELAETMNLPKKSSVAAQLPPKPEAGSCATNNFKAQLKKVEPKKTMAATKEETSSIIDFKSRLRRVENNNENDGTEADPKRAGEIEEKSLVAETRFKSAINDARDKECDRGENRKLSNPIAKKNGDARSILEPDNVKNRKKSAIDSNPKVIDMKKTDNKIDTQDEKRKRETNEANKVAGAEDEDKRKSTGSISSLKKLWESKEVGGTTAHDQGGTQTSPKLSSKNVISNNNKNGDEDNEDHTTTNKKPAVPMKPTKLVSIYATPMPVKMPNDSAGSKAADAPAVGNGTANNANNAAPNTAQISREGILDLVHLLEGSLKLPINSISASQWLQLSDKLNILQCSCVLYASKETMPPHSKFQFRELVTRVETQSRCLRSAGSKNIADNEKLMSEVGQSLKQISNALHR